MRVTGFVERILVANSYFLVVDSDGRLIGASPRITKQYELPKRSGEHVIVLSG